MISSFWQHWHMLPVLTLFLLVLAGVFGFKADGATRSPLHPTARILSVAAFCMGVGVLLQAPDGATTLLTMVMVVGALALFIRLQAQVG